MVISIVPTISFPGLSKRSHSPSCRIAHLPDMCRVHCRPLDHTGILYLYLYLSTVNLLTTEVFCIFIALFVHYHVFVFQYLFSSFRLILFSPLHIWHLNDPKMWSLLSPTLLYCNLLTFFVPRIFVTFIYLHSEQGHKAGFITLFDRLICLITFYRTGDNKAGE